MVSQYHKGGKRHKTGDQAFEFKTFCRPGQPIDTNGPFRENIRALLSYGHFEDHLSRELQTWSFKLEVDHYPSMHVTLFVVEDPVEKSVNLDCPPCRYVGWGNHMICNSKFHFMLPSDERKRKMETSWGEVNSDGPSRNLHAVHASGHLLHGVFHSNGFGHLLCLRGLEGGSKLVTGCQIMDLWDRICSILRARKVSLTDVAKKRGMDLKLVYGLAYGHSWFGQWGYKFGQGTYGITKKRNHNAIVTLRNLPLCLIIKHFSTIPELLTIIARYQMLSGCILQTLGHLIFFMLELKTRLPSELPIQQRKCRFRLESDCRWSAKRVEMAARVIVEALRRADTKWVSRQEVRDIARVSIGDTGLLDFVLKSLGNYVVGNYIVRRALNPVTKVLEYCLEDMSSIFSRPKWLSRPDTRLNIHVNRFQLTRDLLFLYRHICPEHMPETSPLTFAGISAAVWVARNGKHLIKDYKGQPLAPAGANTDHGLKLFCTIHVMNEIEHMKRVSPPYELISLPPEANLHDLKLEAERVFGEVYWCLRTFTSQFIVQVDGKDCDSLDGLIRSCGNVVICGRIDENASQCGIMYQSQVDAWVECLCGAKEDDGEQFISCDICETYQHLRCVQAPGGNHQVFLCSNCEKNIVSFPFSP